MASKPESSGHSVLKPEQIIPQSAEDYTKRGWLFYSAKEYYRAEEDFRQAIQLCPDDIDIHYALGLALKYDGRSQEAIKVFELVNALSDRLEDRVRGNMIKRLSKGHINQITQGDWNLEKEVWKRKG